MKDASHHLRQVQKKVLQENRRLTLREDLTSAAVQNEMVKETYLSSTEEDIDTKFDRAHRAARVLPPHRAGFIR
ncbi:MAG: hypothetical protein WC222_02205 [Parachlamydiales bacterium]|jgi:hypothetical protein